MLLKDTHAVSATRGNDFTLRVKMRIRALADGTNADNLKDFSLDGCTGVKAKLVDGRTGLFVTPSFSLNGNTVNIAFDETMPLGDYGVEITGKDKDGDDWRFFAGPKEAVNIVETSSRASVPTIENNNVYYDMTIGDSETPTTIDIVDEMLRQIGAIKMVALSQEEYDSLVAAGNIDETTYYNIFEE